MLNQKFQTNEDDKAYYLLNYALNTSTSSISGDQIVCSIAFNHS